jgi:hypothetical protein
LQLPLVEHDDRAGGALRAGLPLRPRQRSAIRIGGIGRRERDRRLVVGSEPQSLVGTRPRELSAAETGDEVAAPHFASVFHGLEHRRKLSKASQAVGVDDFSTHDAVAIQEHARAGGALFGDALGLPPQ